MHTVAETFRGCACRAETLQQRVLRKPRKKLTLVTVMVALLFFFFFSTLEKYFKINKTGRTDTKSM